MNLVYHGLMKVVIVIIILQQIFRQPKNPKRNHPEGDRIKDKF